LNGLCARALLDATILSIVIIYGNRHMTVGGLAAEYGFTDLGGLQPDAWRYLVEAETNNDADVADQR
jgi:hypothetical protein